jgi:hypothetical protein
MIELVLYGLTLIAAAMAGIYLAEYLLNMTGARK